LSSLTISENTSIMSILEEMCIYLLFCLNVVFSGILCQFFVYCFRNSSYLTCLSNQIWLHILINYLILCIIFFSYQCLRCHCNHLYRPFTVLKGKPKGVFLSKGWIPYFPRNVFLFTNFAGKILGLVFPFMDCFHPQIRLM
jgi:hypothetical protein